MREVYREPKLFFNFGYTTVCVDKDERLIVEHNGYGPSCQESAPESGLSCLMLLNNLKDNFCCLQRLANNVDNRQF